MVAADFSFHDSRARSARPSIRDDWCADPKPEEPSLRQQSRSKMNFKFALFDTARLNRIRERSPVQKRPSSLIVERCFDRAFV